MRQQRQVFGPLPQRRQPDLHHAQAEKEVLAERARLDQFLQVLVGGCDQTDVGRECFVRANPREGPLPQEAKQLNLNRGINFADLVEEQCAALGLLYPADAPLMGAGKRPFLVAEQFAFQQGRRQARAMQGDHRLLCAWAELMNDFGDEFLAGAALTLQHHSGRRGRDLLDEFEHLFHRRGLSNEVLQAEL